jgi:hypothetical protein
LIATQGHLFSYIGDARCYCSSMSSPSCTTRSLSAEGHSCSDNNTHSLSSEGHSLDLCAQMPPPACPRSPLPAARALRIALNFSPQKVDAAAGLLFVCATAKGARADVDRAILHSVTAAAMLPAILLLGHARLAESPRQGGN